MKKPRPTAKELREYYSIIKKYYPPAKKMKVTAKTPGIHVGTSWFPKGSQEYEYYSTFFGGKRK